MCNSLHSIGIIIHTTLKRNFNFADLRGTPRLLAVPHSLPPLGKCNMLHKLEDEIYDQALSALKLKLNP